MTTIDQRLVYGVFECRVRIYPPAGGRLEHVVVLTWDANSRGRSITNGIEEYASKVCLDFDLDPQNVVWIEHYATGKTAPPFGNEMRRVPGRGIGFEGFKRVKFGKTVDKSFAQEIDHSAGKLATKGQPLGAGFYGPGAGISFCVSDPSWEMVRKEQVEALVDQIIE